MTLLTTAVDSYLSAVKWPLSTAARAFGREDDAPTSPAELTVDRLDVTFRSVAATLLRDDTLARDAERRRIAAAERERALRLLTTAEENEQEAEQRVQRRKQAAAKSAQRRKQASAKASANTKKTLAKIKRQERLEALQTKEAALEEREDALTAADEAQRLRNAAESVKAARQAG